MVALMSPPYLSSPCPMPRLLSILLVLFLFACGQPDALRWERNFPVACPEPSHPGIGHLSGSASAPSFGLDRGLFALGHPDRDL